MDGVFGGEPLPARSYKGFPSIADRFLYFFGKNYHFSSIWIALCTFVESFNCYKIANILTVNFLSLISSYPLQTGQVQNTFKRMNIWVDNFNRLDSEGVQALSFLSSSLVVAPLSIDNQYILPVNYIER